MQPINRTRKIKQTTIRHKKTTKPESKHENRVKKMNSFCEKINKNHEIRGCLKAKREKKKGLQR